MYRISNFTINDGTIVDVNKGDIVVFVGSNNAGKSQALKDIWNLAGSRCTGIVINNVTKDKADAAQIQDFLSSITSPNPAGEGRMEYNGFKFSLRSEWFSTFSLNNEIDDSFRDTFFEILDTEQRLGLTNPPETIDSKDKPNHPIHIIKRDSRLRSRLSDYFHRAFGENLIPGSDQRHVPLYIGDPINLEGQSFANEQDRIEVYQEQLTKYPQVHEQGDGMRSFTGIILNLLIPNYFSFLIDEPESFLHPPQAKILGEILSDLLPENKNIFISTHSEDLIKGLLDKCPERVKLIRLSRVGNTNPAKVLSNNDIRSVWKDSLLRFSNILDSMFHDTTVVCESDSDCRMYGMILDNIKKKENKSNSTLFIHCGGKDRMSLVAKTLKILGVSFRIVPDLDILNDQEKIKRLCETCGGDWNNFQRDYNIVNSFVRSMDTPMKIQEARAIIQDFLDKKESEGLRELSKADIKALKAMISEAKGWDMIKKQGPNGLLRGDSEVAMENILKDMTNINIHLVPVGELENFITRVGDHGPGWVSKVLEAYPDFDDPVYRGISDFISSLNL